MKLGEHLRGTKRDHRPTIYSRHWGKERSDSGRYRIFVNPLLAELFAVLNKDGCYFKETVDDLLNPAKYIFASFVRMTIHHSDTRVICHVCNTISVKLLKTSNMNCYKPLIILLSPSYNPPLAFTWSGFAIVLEPPTLVRSLVKEKLLC